MTDEQFVRLAWKIHNGDIESIKIGAWGHPDMESPVRPADPDGTRHASNMEQEILDGLWNGATVTLTRPNEQTFDFTTPNAVRGIYRKCWPATVDTFDADGAVVGTRPSYLSFEKIGREDRRRARTNARLNPVEEP